MRSWPHELGRRPLEEEALSSFRIDEAFFKGGPSAERTQARAAPSSSARVKQVVDVDSKKVHGMQNFKDAMLKSLVKKSKVGDLPCKDVGDRSGSSTEKQRAIDLSHKNLGCLH